MQEKYELEQLMELVQTKQFRKLRSILMEMNEVDVAEFLDELGPEETIPVSYTHLTLPTTPYV